MSQPLRIGIAGLGTVGTAVCRLLTERAAELSSRANRNLVVTGVSARDKSKDRGLHLNDITWHDDPVDLARSSDIDVFVELIGGQDGPAKDAVESALEAGKHVVTANKALLAYHGVELAKQAEANGVALNFEAAVAGGIPAIKAIRESLVSNRVERVYGILNGTCNYILSRMQAEGRPFDEVLKEAQDAGYAEADPTFDIGGHDAAHKLALLTTLGFGVETATDEIYIEGIEAITLADIEAADDLGYRIKLLGVSAKTESGIEQRVHPTMVPKSTAIAEVDDVTNCVCIVGDQVGSIMLVGPGAGAEPTASAVVSDVVDVARGVVSPPFAWKTEELAPYERAKMREHEGAYYIRLSVYDRPGAFAAIAERMAEHKISLESIVQRRPRSALPGLDAKSKEGGHLPVVMITHETNEAAIRKALSIIDEDGHVEDRPQMIRIENM